MSTLNADRLYALLPAIYRLRDADQGEPLRALVALIANEFEALEENIEQLYDDQFIETCENWVAPYIGDLIGYRPLHGTDAEVAAPRAEVANTIAYRRRKGTAAMLEQLARDVTGWSARAVEFFEQLATTQYMKHIRLYAPATANLRATRQLLDVDTAFNTFAHTAEMRRPETGAGRYNIPNVGLFLWRLRPYSLSAQPLIADPGDASGRKFRLNPIGADLRLFRKPVSETQISHLADPVNVPAPLRIRELAIQLRAAQATTEVLDATDDYGEDRSFVLYREGAVVPINRNGGPPALAIPELRSADLRDIIDGGGTVIGWAHEDSLLPEDIAIDVERGRILFGKARAAENADSPFTASFQYGFSRDIGGGEYERTPSGAALFMQLPAAASELLQAKLDVLAAGGRLLIADSLTYSETPVFKVDSVTADGAPGIEVVVSARDGARPLINASGAIKLDIGARGTLVLEGLVIAGGALTLAAPAADDDEPRSLILRDCTLLPGSTLKPDGNAVTPGAVSLVIGNPFAKVTLERCITGALQTTADAEINASDCIIDAGSSDARAYEGLASDTPGAALTITDSTVIGQVHATKLTLASNSIFFAQLAAGDTAKAPVRVERRQEGCVRFSFVPTGSQVPRRFHCLPDDIHPDVLPQFSSLRYGDAAYAQLRQATDITIRQGAMTAARSA